MTKEEKTKRKLYKKMYKKHVKELKLQAKNCCPFEANDGLELMVEQVRFMYDYYKIGYNVWAMEYEEAEPETRKGTPTRFEMCKQILDEYDAWQNCHDKYFIYHETGGKENGKGLKIGVVKEVGGPVIKEEVTDSWIEYLLPDYHENIEACNKETKEHKAKFFKLYAKYFDDLWD